MEKLLKRSTYLKKKKRLEVTVISSVSEFSFDCLNSLDFEQEEANSLSLSIVERYDKRRINKSSTTVQLNGKNAGIVKKNL